MHESVKQFVEAVKVNARQVWNEPGDESFIDQLLYVHDLPDGSTSISDNFERFFSLVYRVDTAGNWYVRDIFSEMPERPYPFEYAMADASIMYTG